MAEVGARVTYLPYTPTTSSTMLRRTLERITQTLSAKQLAEVFDAGYYLRPSAGRYRDYGSRAHVHEHARREEARIEDHDECGARVVPEQPGYAQRGHAPDFRTGRLGALGRRGLMR